MSGPSASAPRPVASGAAAPAPAAVRGCVEHVPTGKPRPSIEERFPEQGTSGHAASLVVVVEHGRGERVLPPSVRVQAGADDARRIEQAHFVLPLPEGGFGPRTTTVEAGDLARTTLEVPFVPLPPRGGRHELELPAFPVSLSRASGEVVTVCTRPHRIVVDDPIANVLEPAPRENPPPRDQPEVWQAAQHAALGALAALPAGLFAYWLYRAWRRRPRPVAPPPPPRPPWEVALEALEALRDERLPEQSRGAEHVRRTADVVREFLGARYGFDGLESTTREVLAALRRAPDAGDLGEVEAFLRQADLVKFAKIVPTVAECALSLERAFAIVRAAVPEARLAGVGGAEGGP